MKRRSLIFTSPTRLYVRNNPPGFIFNQRILKTFKLQRDSNPRPPQYRCDAIPTELCHTLGARSTVSSYFPVRGVK